MACHDKIAWAIQVRIFKHIGTSIWQFIFKPPQIYKLTSFALAWQKTANSHATNHHERRLQKIFTYTCKAQIKPALLHESAVTINVWWHPSSPSFNALNTSPHFQVQQLSKRCSYFTELVTMFKIDFDHGFFLSLKSSETKIAICDREKKGGWQHMNRLGEEYTRGFWHSRRKQPGSEAS